MNWRVRLVSFLVLALFGGFAFSYFRFYVAPKKHGIILFIVPQAAPQLLALAEYETQGFNALSFADRMALVNHRDDGDYASVMTHLASGTAGRPGEIGLNMEGQRQDTLLYQAQKAGRNVGIISSTLLTSTGAAAFFAHARDVNDENKIALQLFDSTKIDVLMGGSSKTFNPALNTEKRDLLQEAKLEGYQILHNREELENMQAWIPGKVLGVFERNEWMPNELLSARPPLKDLTRRAIQKLQYNLGGYFLVIEHGLVTEAAQQPEKAVQEIVALDEAVRTALDYGGKKTLVLVYMPGAGVGWLLAYGTGKLWMPTIVSLEDIHRILADEL
ncbi:MAG: alkaline phosphatase [bacterium]